MTTEARAHLRRTVRTWLDDPEAVELIRRSLEAGVVLDTWMAGRREESFDTEALGIIEAEITALIQDALGKVFSDYRVSERYLTTAFHELLSSMAVIETHRAKGTLEGGEPEAARAVERLRFFAAAAKHGTPPGDCPQDIPTVASGERLPGRNLPEGTPMAVKAFRIKAHRQFHRLPQGPSDALSWSASLPRWFSPAGTVRRRFVGLGHGWPKPRPCVRGPATGG
ncbi:MAG: hypothetical protein M0Z27_05270 [Thermaerobacter sp.]|nr:hypothetical protein [Thermaerobacter sp.]